MANMTGDTKKLCTSSKDGSASWSDLNHDLLFSIMMHMGVFDFIAFSGVCKSWRSVAVSNWNKFMVSKQPMRLRISTRLKRKDCYLEDYKRRKLRTIIPHSNGRRCFGITCGYLIFFGRTSRTFWLVNPFTRKELHSPGSPFNARSSWAYMRVILVFSPSMSGWVLVVLPRKFCSQIFFSLADKQATWRSISTNFNIHDLHFFKGKIYITGSDHLLWELRLHPEPTLTLQKMKNCLWSNFSVRCPQLLSSGENLYARDASRGLFFEVDFDEMKWVDLKWTIAEHTVFVSDFKSDAAIKPDTWDHPWTRYERVNYFQSEKRRGRCLTSTMWYFPHDCLIHNHSDMENGALLNVLQE